MKAGNGLFHEESDFPATREMVPSPSICAAALLNLRRERWEAMEGACTAGSMVDRAVGVGNSSLCN